jgi:ankyrin repeat protein
VIDELIKETQARHRRDELDASLSRAAQAGDAAGVVLALGAGANPLSRKNGMTPLMFASFLGHAPCVRALIPAGGLEARIPSTKQGALALAMEMGKAECAQALLQAGARVDWRDSSGRSALGAAALAGHLKCVEVGLEHGLVPTARDARRQTPLMLAARMGRLSCVEALLERGNPLAWDEHRMTALLWAAAEGRVECVKALLPVSDAQALNENGSSALGLAANGMRDGATACVRLLMNERAAKMADCWGDTPLMGAIKRGRWENAQALIEVSDPCQKHGQSGKTLGQLTREVSPLAILSQGRKAREDFASLLDALAEAKALKEATSAPKHATKGPRL